MPSTRVKLSVSLPRSLVARIDRAARAESRPRSRVLEDWLSRAGRGQAQQDLEAATIAYYESLTPDEEREDSALAAALSRAARRLDVDGTGTQPKPPRRR